MKRLFLVDDDDSNSLVLSTLLEDEGFVVDTAASLQEAKTKLASGSQYQIILLDHHLSDGLGRSILPLIREKVPDAKVISVSGHPEELKGGPFDGHFLKGEDFNSLLEQINKLLP